MCVTSDRLGLPLATVEAVYRETLRTLSAGASIETFVVLLAAQENAGKSQEDVGPALSPGLRCLFLGDNKFAGRLVLNNRHDFQLALAALLAGSDAGGMFSLRA